MKEEIKAAEIAKLRKYGAIYAVLLALTALSIMPLMAWIGRYAFILWIPLFGIMLYTAVKLEKIKKENNIHTYKEIVAFAEGKRLDEIEKQQEFGKRRYQQFLLVLASAAIGFAAAYLLGGLFLV